MIDADVLTMFDECVLDVDETWLLDEQSLGARAGANETTRQYMDSATP